MASSSRNTVATGVAVAAALALLLVGIFFFASRNGADNEVSDAPSSSAPVKPSVKSIPGYTGTDLFGDQRLAFQYMDKTWQDAYGEPKKGVRTIVLTTHCGLSDITKCPTLRLTDMRSTEFDRRFGNAPIVNVLNQEKCPVTGKAPMTKLTDGGKQNFGEWPGVYYVQALCAATPELPVILNRHLWVSESAMLMAELEDTEYANVSDKDIKDVTTSLKHLAKMAN